jgi:hypothetical protein
MPLEQPRARRKLALSTGSSLLNFTLVGCGMLTLATIIAWHDSYHVARKRSQGSFTAGKSICSMCGKIALSTWRNPSGFSIGMGYRGKSPGYGGEFGPVKQYYDLAWGCDRSFLGFGYDSQDSPNRYRYVVVPYWAVTLLLMSPGSALAMRVLRKQTRRRAGRCPNCSYDLRASTECCPECGEPIAPRKERESTSGIQISK